MRWAEGNFAGTPAARLHAIAAVTVCLLVPGLSWLDGTGSLAWTMYSGSGSSRLRIAAIAADGSRRVIAPTQLAARAGHEMIPYLTGAERWRVAPAGALRRRLADIAPLACQLHDATAIELTLETKRTLDAPVEISSARVPLSSILNSSIVRRIFSKINTTSIPEQPPRPIRTISIGRGPASAPSSGIASISI